MLTKYVEVLERFWFFFSFVGAERYPLLFVQKHIYISYSYNYPWLLISRNRLEVPIYFFTLHL